MQTIIEKVNPESIDFGIMKKMGQIIKAGGLVSFPTETVYGLGANAFDKKAALDVFKAKGRPADNPLIVHVNSVEEAETVVCNMPEAAKKLYKKFSPGPLTVIMQKACEIPYEVTAGLETVAVRIPSHPIARELIKQSGVPIAAPSSNLSGKPSPTIAEYVIKDMNGRIDAIIDGGGCEVGLESTIVDVSGERPVLLRPGGITFNELAAVLPDLIIDEHILKSVAADERPKCPGMKYKHYAPDAEVYVVEGKKECVEEKIKLLLEENKSVKTGVLSVGKTDCNADVVLDAGGDNIEYANRLFTALREFDRQNVKIVFAEFCTEDDHALAVKNRLYKSAGGRVITLSQISSASEAADYVSEFQRES